MTSAIDRETVKEVLDLAKSGQVLTPGGGLEGVERVRLLSEARQCAWEKVYGVDEYTWTDIREKEMAAVVGEVRRGAGNEELEEALSREEKTMLQALRRQLKGQYEDLLDDVFADLSNCALKRAVLGEQPGFFEDLLRVYRSGGWPCGWSGDYPGNGRLVAFWPEK